MTSRQPASVVMAGAKYPAKLHARRVAKELGGGQNGIIFLFGERELMLRDSDQPRPFRQRRYFFYLAGTDIPNCCVTYDLALDWLILWVPTVTPNDVLWKGAPPSPERCMERYDVDEVCGLEHLHGWWEARSTWPVFALHHHQDEVPPWVPIENVDGEQLRPAMDRARVVKTEYEVAMIRRANQVSSTAHRIVAHCLLHRSAAVTNECDVAALFRSICLSHGGARHQAYGIIAGAGANASTLHYTANEDPLAGRQLLLLDAGCEWRGYASDVTRTWPIGGSFGPHAAAVHAIVQSMQSEAIAGVRPGASFVQLHLRAAAIATAGLHRLGILRGEMRDIARAGTVAAFFPHGLGHHIGLEVHDVDGGEPLLQRPRDDLEEADRHTVDGKRVSVTPSSLLDMCHHAASAAAASKTRAAAPSTGDGGVETTKGLRPNMVVTIEPGLYFCRPYIESVFLTDPKHAPHIDAAVLERYYPVGGVRIEDCILVTPTGYENLTTAPKGADIADLLRRRPEVVAAATQLASQDSEDAAAAHVEKLAAVVAAAVATAKGGHVSPAAAAAGGEKREFADLERMKSGGSGGSLKRCNGEDPIVAAAAEEEEDKENNIHSGSSKEALAPGRSRRSVHGDADESWVLC